MGKAEDEELARYLAEREIADLRFPAGNRDLKSQSRELVVRTRKAAGQQMPTLQLYSEPVEFAVPTLLWFLLEDGELVTVWRESDAPGLAHWLRLLLARYHGAWHVAQKPLKSLPAQRKAARDTAEKKKGHGAKEAAIRAEMEAIKAKKKNPKYAMKEIAQSVGCDVSYARRVFRKIAGQ